MALALCYPCGKEIKPPTGPPKSGRAFPKQLKNLAMDIAREVLRYQPEQLLMFIVEYLERRIEERDLSEEARKILNAIIDKFTYEKLLGRRGITRTMANAAATCIQAAWRGYLGRKKAKRLREMKDDQWRLVRSLGLSDDLDWQTLERSAVLIQHHYKKYREKKYKEIKKTKEYVGTFEMRKDYFERLWTRITPFEAFNAALKIQRIMRNYIYEKRRVKDYKITKQIQAHYFLKKLLRHVSLEEANEAARVLQRFYWKRYRLSLFRRLVEAVVWSQKFYRDGRMQQLRQMLYEQEEQEDESEDKEEKKEKEEIQ